jgi:hypothetical protein
VKTEARTRPALHELLHEARALVKWLSAALSSAELADVPVTLAAHDPGADAKPGVYLTRLGFTAEPAHTRARLQLRAHYLLRPVSLPAEQVSDVLGELAFALLAQDTWELTLPSALPDPGLQPSLGLRLSMLVIRLPDSPTPVRVRKHLGERPHDAPPMFAEVSPLVGKVVGPGGVPVVGALVQWQPMGLTSMSDGQGMFRFASAPPRGRPVQLSVQATGRRWDLTVSATGGAEDAPLTVEVSFEKED